MRITPRQYAEGLYEAVRHAEVSDRPAMIDRFLVRMMRDRRRRDIPAIFRHIERIAEREAGMKHVEIISSKTFSGESLYKIEQEGKKIFREEKILFQQKIQSKLFGGVVFRTENETFDGSIGGRLGQLKRFLEQNA